MRRPDQQRKPRKSDQEPHDHPGNGLNATRSDAMPEGTVCSAQLRPPLPTNSNKAPAMTAVRQCATVGLIPVFLLRTGYRNKPTVKCLSPARTSGGNDSTPMRIAK